MQPRPAGNQCVEGQGLFFPQCVVNGLSPCTFGDRIDPWRRRQVAREQQFAPVRWLYFPTRQSARGPFAWWQDRSIGRQTSGFPCRCSNPKSRTLGIEHQPILAGRLDTEGRKEAIGELGHLRTPCGPCGPVDNGWTRRLVAEGRIQKILQSLELKSASSNARRSVARKSLFSNLGSGVRIFGRANAFKDLTDVQAGRASPEIPIGKHMGNISAFLLGRNVRGAVGALTSEFSRSPSAGLRPFGGEEHR